MANFIPKKTENEQNSGLSVALGLFAQLSGWLIGPLVISLFLGRYLDDKFNTRPWLFLLTTALAFAVTIFGLVQETMKYLKEIDKKR
ncbi:MAG: hypothetical protein A3J65_02970 [Candidatus Buchananbacteria bacterium RIFCSPHIGHO2_02_FULL_45_11b]|uniref:F0F1 ATP synthase subunit n=3 Tax=Candidatus Buchananiibacteriota TaxID=1817903 RepID=A0A1G1YC06_9BACT|nr:MAG: hypothetical protein A2663_03760 [Candidatus Buchananbacteria bacterium RIFCSPHIGHO2_01_FULL_46_12]OGY50788.1 MAG: hypothetical protein A3J65_02970 [Candidatus Buchananbacteria bacterium RIFCSPHIGHO2_02_FULL_45_11b]OGY55836.1 MAG: hypothetical protein A3H67_01490 [Candidatus Buchananbacteria bacterium RIFCSPLOWO2_02_FULL_46_11b]